MSHTQDEVIKIEGRLSYPHLFEKYAGPNGDSENPKYTTKLLIDPKEQAKAVAHLKAKMKECAATEWNKNGKTFFPKLRCLTEGEGEEEGLLILSASENLKPWVVDRKREPLTAEDDDKIYPGATVILYIKLWAQDNKWGKRINANLIGVQYKKATERIAGRVQIEADEVAEDLGEDEDGASDGFDDDGAPPPPSHKTKPSRAAADAFDDDIPF